MELLTAVFRARGRGKAAAGTRRTHLPDAVTHPREKQETKPAGVAMPIMTL